MFKKVNRASVREKKHLAIRNKISGTAERPRLSVYRSNNNIFAQLIDDVNGVTLVSASTIAERAAEKGIKEVVFDRSGYKYTGRIAALAEAAREAGLSF